MHERHVRQNNVIRNPYGFPRFLIHRFCDLLECYWLEHTPKPVKSINKALKRLCKACNITAGSHVLRHTTTWLVMDSVPLREVARLLGNSEAMVEKVYGKHAPDYLRRAVNALSFSRKEVSRLDI